MKLNDRHRRFCENLVKGMTNKDAYAGAGFKATGKSLEINSSKLIKKPEIVELLAKLREQAAKDAAVDGAEVIKWLADVMRTAIADIDEHSPLCQEVKYDISFGQDDEKRETLLIKMVPKIPAVGMLVKHFGLEADETLNIGGLASFIKKVRDRRDQK